MDEAGADALRFAVIHGATPGQDQRFGQQKLETGRNFANKLWNATRYVLGARPDSIPSDAARRAPDPGRLGPAERWIRSRAAATVAEVDDAIGDYQLAEVTRALYDGIWSEFCDWGLELAKVRLADTELPAAEREATWWTLVEALDTYVRLLHPVMPYITEELWSVLPHAADDPDLIIVARWPEAASIAAARDAELEGQVGQVLDLVTAIRNARATAGLAAGAWLPTVVAVPAGVAGTFTALTPAIERLARARPLTTVADPGGIQGPDGALAVVAGGLEARIGTAAGGREAGGVASASERARLEKELAQAGAALASVRARLADPAFLQRAPAQVVAGARASEADLAERVERLSASLRQA